jgi:ABC-2 type transport system permease protein
MKDLKLLWRDKVGFFWVLGFPLLVALFFGSIYSGGTSSARSMKIAVVTDDMSLTVRAFYDQLSQSSVLDIHEMPLDSARPLVARGELVAFVQYFDSSKSTFDIFTGKKPHIKVGIDPSRKAEAGYLNGLINQAYFMGLQSRFMDIKGWRGYLKDQRDSLDKAPDRGKPGPYGNYLDNLDNLLASVEQIDSAYQNSKDSTSDSTAAQDNSPFAAIEVDFDDVAENRSGPRSPFEITFPQALQWALIATAAAFSLSIVTERTRGTFLRLRLAPIGRVQVLAGKGLACFTFCVGVCALLMAIGIFIFGVRVASWINLILAILAGGFCFVGLMMLISVMGKTEASVSGAGWAIMLVMSMLGGGMMPLMFMPSWLRSISHISPVKWSVLALEGSIWRDFGWTEMLPPLAVLVGVGAVGFIVGATILSRSDG